MTTVHCLNNCINYDQWGICSARRFVPFRNYFWLFTWLLLCSISTAEIRADFRRQFFFSPSWFHHVSGCRLASFNGDNPRPTHRCAFRDLSLTSEWNFVHCRSQNLCRFCAKINDMSLNSTLFLHGIRGDCSVEKHADFGAESTCFPHWNPLWEQGPRVESSRIPIINVKVSPNPTDWKSS